MTEGKKDYLTYHAVPFAGLLVEAAVGPVLHQLDGVVEAQDLRDLVDDVHAVPLVPDPHISSNIHPNKVYRQKNDE